MCPHQPPCPPADRPGRDAARTIARHAGKDGACCATASSSSTIPAGSCPTAPRCSRVGRATSRCPPPPEMAGRFGSPRTGCGSPPDCDRCIRVQLTPVFWLTTSGHPTRICSPSGIPVMKTITDSRSSGTRLPAGTRNWPLWAADLRTVSNEYGAVSVLSETSR
jgi:hypothetical protein